MSDRNRMPTDAVGDDPNKADAPAKKKDIPFTVTLPPEDVDRLRRVADERKIRQKTIVQEALTMFLDRMEAGAAATELGLNELAMMQKEIKALRKRVLRRAEAARR